LFLSGFARTRAPQPSLVTRNNFNPLLRSPVPSPIFSIPTNRNPALNILDGIRTRGEGRITEKKKYPAKPFRTIGVEIGPLISNRQRLINLAIWLIFGERLLLAWRVTSDILLRKATGEEGRPSTAFLPRSEPRYNQIGCL